MSRFSKAERRWLMQHAPRELVVPTGFAVVYGGVLWAVGFEAWVIGAVGTILLLATALRIIRLFKVEFRSFDPLEGQLPGIPMWGATGRWSGVPAPLIDFFSDTADLATKLHKGGRVAEAERLRAALHAPIELSKLTQQLMSVLREVNSPELSMDLSANASRLTQVLGEFIAAEESRGDKAWRYGA